MTLYDKSKCAICYGEADSRVTYRCEIFIFVGFIVKLDNGMIGCGWI